MFGSTSFRWIVGIAISFTLALFAWMAVGYSYNSPRIFPAAILQGDIFTHPTRPTKEPEQVQPGTSVGFKLIVSNIGQEPSESGQAYIRYALATPLQNQSHSVIFQTEKMPLPSIEPGKEVELTFTTLHQWPSLFDFVRYDWPMREYQAVVSIDGEEKIISSLAITVSAYYYPGMKKVSPSEVPNLSRQLKEAL